MHWQDDFKTWFSKKWHWNPCPQTLTGLEMYMKERDLEISSRNARKTAKGRSASG